MRRIVSAMMLILLLIGMLTMAYNIQPVKADFKTSEAEKSFSVEALRFEHNGTNHNKKRNKEQARVVEHRIATLELKKLKREIGVWEEDRNYNQIINGHGTGLCPPTEEKWAEIVNKIYMVERVLLNQIIQSPSSVDHTTKPWFPPIGDQDGEGSCIAWAVGYYLKTFQEAKEHGWDLSGAEWEGGYPTPAYQDRIFSPDFIYHLINGGVDQGSYFSDAINVISAIGASSWEKMPYDPADSTSWPSENAWREAPLYRGNSSGYEYLELNTDDDLISLKNFIASDHLALISVDAYQYSNLTSEDFWTLDNYVNISTNHANTIVGYNDDIKYLEQGEWRYGAFKIANSWGEGGWENIPNGCYWISYEALKQRVKYCMFYRDRIGYGPELVSSFRIDHSKRGECDISIGMGNHSNAATTKSFSDLIDGGGHPFCSNNIVFDITEFKDVVPKVINQSFFMEVYDGGIPPAHSGMYEWCSDGESYSWFRLGQTFDMPETGATLKFWSYYEIEEDWDYGYVEVHDLDADEWYTLPGLMTVSTLPERQDNPNCPSEFEPAAYYDAGRWNAFTGFSGAMYQEEMDLTPFANHTIELYFTYWTDPFVLERGWYIDDIEIPEVGFFDNVESGPSDWTYNGWHITIPNTTGTISSFSIEYYNDYSSNSLRAESASPDAPVNTTDEDYVFAELTLTGVHHVDVNVSEAKQMIESNSDLVILDVRTLEEYESGHIENAVLIPVSELEERLDELDEEKETLVYCRSGGRSATASQVLVDNGFANVYNMLGGIIAWRDAGYWIEIIHEGDLIIDGTQTYTIENCAYIQTGNVYVSYYGQLIVRNCKFELNQSYQDQYGIFVDETGSLEMNDVRMISPKISPVVLRDSSKGKINNVSTNSRFESIANSELDIANSTFFAGLVLGDFAEVVISNSIMHPDIALDFRAFSGRSISLEKLMPGFLKFWNIYKNESVHNIFNLTIENTHIDSWELAFSNDIIEVEVKDSIIGSLWLDFENDKIDIHDLKLGFHSSWNVQNIWVINSSITNHWAFILSNVTATFSNSTIHLHLLDRLSNVFVNVSKIRWIILDWADVSLYLNQTILYGGILLANSELYICGEVTFEHAEIDRFVLSNVIRNYRTIATDRNDNPIEKVELTLFDQNNTVVWNGITDNLGKTSFNLTFTDNNYTDTLRLEAVKGDFSTIMNVTFLSDTPVVLKMRYFADLNGDGTVNIFDMFIIAKAFRTKEGDENWNPIADLDDNKEINIIDLYKVAKDYGKTI